MAKRKTEDETPEEPVGATATDFSPSAGTYLAGGKVYRSDDDLYLLGETRGEWGLIKFQNGSPRLGRNGVAIDELEAVVADYRERNP